MRSSTRTLLLGATLGAVLALPAAPASATFAGTPGRIAVEADPCPATPGGCPVQRRPILVDPATGTVTDLDADGTRLRLPQFSPGGTRLLGLDAKDGRLLTARADGSDPRPVRTGGTVPTPPSAAWDSAGDIAFVAGTGLRAVDPPTGRTTDVEASGFRGAQLVSSIGDPVGQPIVAFQAPRFGHQRARFVLYASLRPGSVGMLPPPLLPDTEETSPDLLPDGRAALLRTRPSAEGSTIRLLVTSDVQLGARTILRRSAASGPAIESVAWSPDGTRLALLAGGDLLTVAADGTDLRTVAHLPDRRLVGRLSWQAR